MLFDHFSKIIIEKIDELNDKDISNCLTTFAEVDYLNYDCLAVLMKKSIQMAPEMDIHSLSLILHSFVIMDVINESLFSACVEILDERLDIEHPNCPKWQACLSFLESFIRAGKFEEQ